MELPGFLNLSKSRRFLTLSESSKTEQVVPRLRDVSLKASVHISDATLLDYQHDLRTNSTFFHIRLGLDPATADVSALQQFFIVNGLCDEFMLELDYDRAIIAEADSHEEKQKLLVEYAEDLCNRKISRELEIAEKLLNTDPADFFGCVEKTVDNLLQADIEPAVIEAGLVPLAEKSSQVYFEWYTLIEDCIGEFVARARIDTGEFAIDSPFEMVDLAKVKTLGSLLGEIYEGSDSWAPGPLQTRKYHVGSVRVCPSRKLSPERIKKCLAHCAASFFVTLSKSPIGRRFQPAAEALQQKYIERTREWSQKVVALAREEKALNLHRIREHAKLLVRKLGPEGERLKLAMEHEIDLLPIYHDTLTEHIRDEIEAALNRGLALLYPTHEIDLSRAVGFASDEFPRCGKVSLIDSPDLLTLRVSHIVTEYFDEHAWLLRLDVRQPEIRMLTAAAEARDEAASGHARQLVLIDDYLDHATLRHPGILIDIDKIELASNREEEIVALHRI